MASRKEQKEAARQAREQAIAELKAQQARRTRLLGLGGVLVVVLAAVVVFIVASSGGGGNIKSLTAKNLSQQRVDSAPYSAYDAVAKTKSLLAGIPQSGNVLGYPSAPVTITEFGDLACPTCDDYAVSTETQLISQYVRTGKVKLVYRADETASGYANGKTFLTSQVAARSAGLQGKEWDYIMLVYYEQPQEINGNAAEDSAYMTASYLQNRAAQVPGLNTVKWQRGLTNAALIKQVHMDLAAAVNDAPRGTPTLIVKGQKGAVTYDSSGTLSAVPSLAALAAEINQVS